ncbi:MAG: hypothetical protein O6922_00655 [Chloroflexi bacterium]|nr:hypothetical protein [Chloroflexota bacterium]
MISKALTLCLVAVAAMLLVASCGSDDTASSELTSDGEVPPLITRIDQTFTPDSFVQAGWKQSKQYDTATVPQAIEIWYGFYNQKDIEIRFYPSHQEAIEFGITAAESSIEGAVKRSQGGRLLDFSGGSFSGYADYVVVGNAVLLCQLERSTCESLLEQLK